MPRVCMSVRGSAPASGRLVPILVLLFLGLVLTRPTTSSAHAFLVQTTPRAGERLFGSPSELVLQFSEPVTLDEDAVVLRTLQGTDVQVGPAAQGRTEVRIGLPPLAPAVYVVNWNVLAGDGHQSAGEFAFAVGGQGVISSPVTATNAPIAWPDAAASALVLIGLALAGGGLASELVVWRPVANELGLNVPRAPLAAGLAAAGAGAAGQAALLLSETARFDQLIKNEPALLAIAEIVLIGYAGWIGWRPSLRGWSLIPLAAAMSALLLGGHAGAGAWWAVPANGVHVALALIWLGALAHLVLVLWRTRGLPASALLTPAARRYATLALLLVPPLLLAGVITAVDRLSQPADLIESTYGQILVAKSLLAVVALSLALGARLRALPDASLRFGLLRRLTSSEIGVLVGVLGLSAILASAAPPRTQAAIEADLLGPPPLDGPVVRLAALTGQLAMYVAAANEQLQLSLLTPDGDPASTAQVLLQGVEPDGQQFELYPRSCGRGCFSLNYAWQVGNTELSVSVPDSPDWPGGSATVVIPWPPQPDDPALLDRVIQSMREQASLTLDENVTSGPGSSGGDHIFPIGGEQFIDGEPYAGGGATDVRLLQTDADHRVMTAFLPGSALWFRFELDSHDRITHETIVDPGHQIERRFTYDA